MATVNYTTLLGLALPTQGDLTGTWGTEVNEYISKYVDAAVAGTQTISGSQTAVTLSVTQGSSLSQAAGGATGSSQYMVINCTGNPASLLTITAPAASKAYIIINATSTNQQVKIVGVGPTTGVTLDAGERAIVTWNGSDFVKAASSFINNLSGTLSVAKGGTGRTSLTANALLLGDGTSGILQLSPVTSGFLYSNGSTWTTRTVSVLTTTDTTSLGIEANNSSTVLSYNTAVGYRANYSAFGGSNTVAVGYRALYSNNASGNTGVGFEALYANTTGVNNVALGTNSLRYCVSGASNTAAGASALKNTTVGSSTAFGAFALEYNSTGAANTAVGSDSLRFNTTGSTNTAVGANACISNTTGSSNTAVGANALYVNAVGYNNTAIGRDALRYLADAIQNTAVGANALYLATTGYSNTAVGYNALGGITTGSANVGIGNSAGSNLITGTNNIVIGENAAASSSSATNEITLGNSGITTLRCQVTTITSLSDARDKKDVVSLPAGLNFVRALNPVAFKWNTRDGAKVDVPDTGFIAQELQAAQTATGVTIPGLVYDNNPDQLEAGYGKLIPVLVKAIQELSAEVERLKSKQG